MKFGIRPSIACKTILLATALFQAGCASTGMQRSEKTRTTMGAVELDYQKAIAQVDATGASLEILINPGLSDPKKAFGKYSDNVDRMEELGKRLFEHSDNMRSQQKQYFEEWRMQGNKYSNPEIEALSEQRRADLSAYFVQISEASVGVKGSFKAYMSDIREIKTYLSNDLTPKGIESITPTSRKAVLDGKGLKDSVDPVLTAIGNARMELKQGGKR